MFMYIYKIRLFGGCHRDGQQGEKDWGRYIMTVEIREKIKCKRINNNQLIIQE